jgi:hypothetical protein
MSRRAGCRIRPPGCHSPAIRPPLPAAPRRLPARGVPPARCRAAPPALWGRPSVAPGRTMSTATSAAGTPDRVPGLRGAENSRRPAARRGQERARRYHHDMTGRQAPPCTPPFPRKNSLYTNPERMGVIRTAQSDSASWAGVYQDQPITGLVNRQLASTGHYEGRSADPLAGQFAALSAVLCGLLARAEETHRCCKNAGCAGQCLIALSLTWECLRSARATSPRNS